MEKEFLSKIIPGDHVWVGSYNRPKYEIRTVEKLTPTQIVLERGGRYRRDSGYRIGDVSWSGNSSITGIATRVEVEAWNKKQADDAAEYQRQQRAKEARELQQKNLQALLPKGLDAWVSDAEVRDSRITTSAWKVTINDLTPADVENLAKLLAKL